MSARQRRRALAELAAYETRQKDHFLGYQANQKLDYEDDLSRYLNFHVNNIGDPFYAGNFTVNSRVLERAVLDYYARLWHAPWPSVARSDPERGIRRDPESYWGYVLTMGSSEGNIYGLWNGRDYLAGKFLMSEPDDRKHDDGAPRPSEPRLVYQQARLPEGNPNAYSPVAFYSQDTHYSIVKMMRVLAIRTFYDIGTENYPGQCPITHDGTWPQEAPSTEGAHGPGTIDPLKLASLVEFFASKGYPILLSFNYGSTFKGAYDDIPEVMKLLEPILKKHGLWERKVHYDPKNPERFDTRSGFWVHVDGALGAAYMPFIEMAHAEGRIKQRGPDFDFRLGYVHSIVMSGHKWIGAPWPCGVYMTKCKYQLLPPDDPAYITGSPDTTFAGSRNGFSPIILWSYLAKTSHKKQIAKALYTDGIAAYAERQLLELEKRLDRGAGWLWVARSPLSLTVRFRGLVQDFVTKYSLSGEGLTVGGQAYVYSHVYAMEHVTRAKIDAFIADIWKHRKTAFIEPNPSTPPTRIVEPTGARPLVYVPTEGRGFR